VDACINNAERQHTHFGTRLSAMRCMHNALSSQQCSRPMHAYRICLNRLFLIFARQLL
jgi:hypothetical protein